MASDSDNDDPIDEPDENSGDADFSLGDFSPESSDPDDAAFPPPPDPIPVSCIHCGAIFSSSAMVKRFLPHMGESAWCCPDDECDGVGFCFDIWPVDPDWRDADGNPVSSDALPPNFPAPRGDCLWVDGDEEILYEDDTPGRGGYRQMNDFDNIPGFWKPGTEPPKPGDENDIPF